jgi:hypothetical protein
MKELEKGEQAQAPAQAPVPPLAIDLVQYPQWSLTEASDSRSDNSLRTLPLS